jgi:hypothetical protein
MSDAVTELRVAMGHEAIADDETQRIAAQLLICSAVHPSAVAPS